MESYGWPLIMTKLSGPVDGTLRMHNYALLARLNDKKLSELGFYRDWRLGPYGPYSPALADDIKHCVKRKLLSVEFMTGEFNPIRKYTLVDDLGFTEESGREHKKEFGRMRQKLEECSKMRHPDLLHQIYWLAPGYAMVSRKGFPEEMGRGEFQSDSELGTLDIFITQ